ncbi:MAG: SoxR reducing system RseC family protein [Actinobacteria bacterium]|nr:SoxR reducing system RseC family protein [Actinomycetota bacterium]
MIKREGGRALVRVARVNCAECGGCGLLARNREHTMEFSAVNRLGAVEGDRVILSVPSRRISLTYLAVFGLPLLSMAAAFFAVAAIWVIAGAGDGQGPGVIAAVLTGFLSFWGGVKLADRIGLFPVITQVIGPGDADDDKAQGYVL